MIGNMFKWNAGSFVIARFLVLPETKPGHFCEDNWCWARSWGFNQPFMFWMLSFDIRRSWGRLLVGWSLKWCFCQSLRAGDLANEASIFSCFFLVV